jgi:hypothetical protein
MIPTGGYFVTDIVDRVYRHERAAIYQFRTGHMGYTFLRFLREV